MNGTPGRSSRDAALAATLASGRAHGALRVEEGAIAIRCPGCGREYDVALFQYGRTIWCTCGRRVAADTVERALGRGPAVRFLADSMLGRLARWLRLLGLDCAWEADLPDAELVRRAVREGRTILTRDRSLPEEWRVSGIHVLRAAATFDQLVEVLRRFGLADAVRLFQRCSRCNAPLERVPTGEVWERVPPDVRAGQPEVRRCRACGRVYWEGSHTRRMERVAEALLRAV